MFRKLFKKVEPEKPRPILRFTIGPCNKAGLDVTRLSLKVTTRALGDRFDYVVCHNGWDEGALKKALGPISDRVAFHKQTWNESPVPDELPSVLDEEGKWNVYGSKCGGSMWKYCPARIRMDAHEIIMDNDIVIFRFPEIFDKFLESDKVMILNEHIGCEQMSASGRYNGSKIRQGRQVQEYELFYGRYKEFFSEESMPKNSSLIGLPPGFNFGRLLKCTWENHGSLAKLTQWDEQGLAMLALSDEPQIQVRGTELPLFVSEQEQCFDKHTMFGIHFAQSNKLEHHLAFEAVRDRLVTV